MFRKTVHRVFRSVNVLNIETLNSVMLKNQISVF